MFKSGESPIPGYSLLRMLGRGEYGEVWEVEGPGGTHLAIKFIPLHDKKGQVELRSIQAVKLIRHANLVPIHAIWLLDTDGKVMESDSLGKAIAAATQNRADKTLVVGAPQFDESIAYLVICMSLADGNLQDTLDESIKAGKSGIPVKELLEYTRQAAIGLDFLNSPVHLVDGAKVGIQHRDVKPANLLVMGDTVVVGDFGVATTVKEFDATGTSALGSMAFMAPESFSRKPSQSSDQYALAITYYKLRSNHLPYDPNVSISELIAIHNNGRLDFSKVPAHEQKVLAKATSPDPKSRFSTCKEFCEALVECHRQTAPAKRSKAPAIATAISVIAIGLITILLLDPLGWFVRPDPPVVTEVPRKNYVLTITPGDVTGTLAIRSGSSDDLINSVDLHGVNIIELDGSERIAIRADAPGPFLGGVDRTFTVDELAKQNWKISLPEISHEEWHSQIDQLLESEQWDEASRAYSNGAKFDASLKSLPVPATYEYQGSVDRFVIGNIGHQIAISSQKTSGESQPVMLSIENDQLVPKAMPATGQQSSLVRSLLFSHQGNQLIIVREKAIERWDVESGMVSTLLSSSVDSEFEQNWSSGVLSEDGKWLAVHDNRDTVQFLDLNGASNEQPISTDELQDRLIGKMLFVGSRGELMVVCDSLPVYFATIPRTSGEKVQIRSLTADTTAGDQIVIDAALLGNGSIMVVTKQSVFVCPEENSGSGKRFELWKQLDRPTISFLRASDSRDWFLTATESDPSAYLWNLDDKEDPAFRIGTQQVPAISQACFSSNGKWAAIVSRNGVVKLLDLRSPTPQLLDFQHFDDAKIQHVGFTPDSRYLIVVKNSGSQRSEIFAWDFQRCWLVLDAQASSAE